MNVSLNLSLVIVFWCVWKLHGQKLNNYISRSQERCLRLTYKDHKGSFEELFEMSSSVSVHYKNLQSLTTELYNVFSGISPDIMKDAFLLNTSSDYNIRNRSTFQSRPINSVYNGTESLSHLAPKIWEHVPNDIKALDSLPQFQNEIK